MNAVKKDVEALVEKELEAANKKFPLFNSPHEGYAVILEEFEELTSAAEVSKRHMGQIWGCIKSNDEMKDYEINIEELHDNAINVACEAIQTAAMCEKFKMSLSASAGKTRCSIPQNVDKVRCRDCDYLNTDRDKPFCCHPKMSTNGLDDWCCHGKKRGKENA